jgi:hypothetical protein
MRSRAPRATSLFVVLAAVACTDALGTAGREPSKIEVNAGVPIAVTEGGTVAVPIRVLDQHGRAFERLPPWIVPSMSISDTSLAAVQGDAAVGRRAGQTFASIHVGELRATAYVRVNPGELAVMVDGVQLMQSVQRTDGTVPVVANRDALLRVYVRADRLNFFDAGIRVRVYAGEVLRATYLLDARDAGIPQFTDEGLLSSTWNVVIPAAHILPGMGVRVDADHGGVLPRTSASSPDFPSDGSIHRFDVRAVPALQVRMVPVRLSSTGAQGIIDSSNLQAFINDVYRWYPVSVLNADVRTPYTTDRTDFVTDEWIEILSEIRALRVADGSSRYYYGVLRQRPGQPIGGIAYIGGRSGIGHDQMPRAAEIYAHELGHNFGRLHAPCGNPLSIDPEYPHDFAAIGAHGIDVDANQLIPPTHKDLLSYCTPWWVSDYTYEAVLAYREAHAAALAAVPALPAQPSLIVWGRISNGQVTLEPAFIVNTVPSVAQSDGEFSVEGRDATGATVFSVSIDGDLLGDGEPGERHFAHAVPLSASAQERLTSLRISGVGVQPAVRVSSAPLAAARSGGVAAAQPSVMLRRAGPAAFSMQWDATTHPLVVVRDPVSGDILSFARSGRIELPGSHAELELIVSDGVRSSTSRVRVQ